jgi:hypothetical protein
MRPFLDSLLYGPCEIQLRKPPLLVVAKHRDNQPSTARRDPEDGASRLPEDDTRHVRAVD